MRYPWLRVDILLPVFLFLNEVLLSLQTYQEARRTMLFKWKVPEFENADEAIEQGNLIPQNALIMDSDYYAPAGRFFATTPLFKRGVPSSLWEVVGPEGKLRPFPYRLDYTSNAPSCDGVYSVFRIQIDQCNRLWAVDTGVNYFVNVTASLSCPPKLLAYDLDNGDREVLRYEFPKGTVYNEFSTFANFIVESNKRNCSDTFIYISNVRFNRMVVFDYAAKSSWRVEHPTFYPYPDYSLLNVNGIVLNNMDGLLGLALGPAEPNRKLYYHSFASVKEAWIPISILKNQTAATQLNFEQSAVVTVSRGERTGRSSVEVMTDDGILIYPVLPENSIVCWNSKTPFTAENQHILARDDVNFQYITGMKLKDNNLMFTSCRLQLFLRDLQNQTDYNYRIIVIEDVKRLLANTPCANNVAFGANSYRQKAMGLDRSFIPLPVAVGPLYNPVKYIGEFNRQMKHNPFTRHAV